MATDFTIQMSDEPGQLARLGEALGAAGVNIEGFFGVASGGTGEIHVAVEDVATAKSALQDAGIEIAAESEVAVIDCADQPGELGRIARKVADAGVNLTFAYLATGTRVVLAGPDVKQLEGTL